MLQTAQADFEFPWRLSRVSLPLLFGRRAESVQMERRPGCGAEAPAMRLICPCGVTGLALIALLSSADRRNTGFACPRFATHGLMDVAHSL